MSEICCADAFEYLSTLADGVADIIILDPPYDKWKEMLDRGIVEEAMRVIKDTGNIICFTKQPFDFDVRVAVNKIFRREIVWTFSNGGAWVSNRMPLVSHQQIYWCCKNAKKCFFNERTGMEYSENTRDFKRSSKVWEGYSEEGRQFEKNPNGVWLRDHLHFNKPNAGKIPQKPEQLIRVLLTCFCPSGGLLVDPFMGSGIIERVADDMCIDYLACDNDADIVDKVISGFWEVTDEDRIN